MFCGNVLNLVYTYFLGCIYNLNHSSSRQPQSIMDQVLQQQLSKVAEIMEGQVDAEIHRLDNLDEDELDVLRQRRLVALKKQREKEDEWRSVSCRKIKQK